jgi:hypothetical protein
MTSRMKNKIAGVKLVWLHPDNYNAIAVTQVNERVPPIMGGVYRLLQLRKCGNTDIVKLNVIRGTGLASKIRDDSGAFSGMEYERIVARPTDADGQPLGRRNARLGLRDRHIIGRWHNLAGRQICKRLGVKIKVPPERSDAMGFGYRV